MLRLRLVQVKAIMVSRGCAWYPSSSCLLFILVFRAGVAQYMKIEWRVVAVFNVILFIMLVSQMMSSRLAHVFSRFTWMPRNLIAAVFALNHSRSFISWDAARGGACPGSTRKFDLSKASETHVSASSLGSRNVLVFRRCFCSWISTFRKHHLFSSFFLLSHATVCLKLYWKSRIVEARIKGVCECRRLSFLASKDSTWTCHFWVADFDTEGRTWGLSGQSDSENRFFSSTTIGSSMPNSPYRSVTRTRGGCLLCLRTPPVWFFLADGCVEVAYKVDQPEYR